MMTSIRSLISEHSHTMGSFIYWLTVAMLMTGIASYQLVPPKMDVVALSGIFFICALLRSLIPLR